MREQLASIWRDLEEYICCTLLGVIMTLLMMQVCYRYFGGKSIAWSEEVSRFLEIIYCIERKKEGRAVKRVKSGRERSRREQ